MGDFPHTFTDEERRRGGENRAAAFRAQRESARQEASQELGRLAVKAVGRLERAMDDDNDEGVRAAIHVLDRILGKPAQPAVVTGAEGGPLEYRLLSVIERARQARNEHGDDGPLADDVREDDGA